MMMIILSILVLATCVVFLIFCCIDFNNRLEENNQTINNLSEKLRRLESYKRPSAKEADEVNMEILRKW